MHKQTVIISLGAGLSQLPLIRKAREEGFSIVAIDQNPDAPGVTLADEFINISTYNIPSVVHCLEILSPKYVYAGIVSRVSGPALYTAAAISKRFDLRGLTKEFVPLSTEKAILREFCDKNKLPFPRGKKINNTADISAIRLPVIIKPDLPLVGKKNVFFVDDFNQSDSLLKHVFHSSYNGFAEIEEFIEGIDVSCMFRLNRGVAEVIAFWDELVVVENSCDIRGIGVSTPSVISGTPVQSEILSIVDRLSGHFPDIDSVIAISFRINFQKQIFIIELHADLTGDMILDVLLPAAFDGVDFFSIPLNVATGNQPELKFLENCKPTVVIYNDISFDVIQKRNLLELLAHVNLSYCSSGAKPRHLEWLNLFGDGR